MKINQYTPYYGLMPIADLSCLSANGYKLMPFDERTIHFLDSFSKLILTDSNINRRPEITALGFWLRKAQMKKILGDQNCLFNNSQYRIAPIGKVLHICPANVDTMFIYSMVVALLMGNKNILRVSRRMDAPHVLNLFDKLNYLMEVEEYELFKNYINIISYDHDDEISNYLSSNVNARLIWGGDSTIRIFQTFTKAPRTKDIVFADRISMLVLNSSSVLSCDGKAWSDFLRNFYNDAYTFDQMGCSSPQTIYFLGSTENCISARKKLIESLEVVLIELYENDLNSIASLKLNRMVDDAIDRKIMAQSGNNLVKLLELTSISDSRLLHSCGGGYFYYKDCISISDLEMLTVPKVQTISHFGLSQDEREFLFDIAYGEGIDRIVSLGHALDFHYIWDGYNLFQELSRKVYIET